MKTFSLVRKVSNKFYAKFSKVFDQVKGVYNNT